MKESSTKENHTQLAASINGRTWQLIEQKELSLEEKDELIHAAHASAFHWCKVGTVLEKLRAEWLISRAYSRLENGESTLRHAKRCLEFTEGNLDVVKDFDIAYAYEGVARGYALLGDTKNASVHYKQAIEQSKKIVDKGDLKIFSGDFNGGNWNGFKFE